MVNNFMEKIGNTPFKLYLACLLEGWPEYEDEWDLLRAVEGAGVEELLDEDGDRFVELNTIQTVKNPRMKIFKKSANL